IVHAEAARGGETERLLVGGNDLTLAAPGGRARERHCAASSIMDNPPGLLRPSQQVIEHVFGEVTRADDEGARQLTDNPHLEVDTEVIPVEIAMLAGVINSIQAEKDRDAQSPGLEEHLQGRLHEDDEHAKIRVQLLPMAVSLRLQKGLEMAREGARARDLLLQGRIDMEGPLSRWHFPPLPPSFRSASRP